MREKSFRLDFQGWRVIPGNYRMADWGQSALASDKNLDGERHCACDRHYAAGQPGRLWLVLDGAAESEAGEVKENGRSHETDSVAQAVNGSGHFHTVGDSMEKSESPDDEHSGGGGHFDGGGN